MAHVASRAPVRVGYDIPGRTWMYTRVVHRPRGLHPRHSVENQWDLLRAVDPAIAATADPAIDRCEMPVDPAARASAARRLSAFGVPDEARIIVLHVSAGNPFRRWPESAFADLASSLVAASPDRWVIFTGGPSDREATARVIEMARRQCPGAANRLVDGEALSLSELRALCDRSALYIGGDSGPLHIAATTRTPIVALFGPTLPERSMPWRDPAIGARAVDAGPLPCRPCDQRVCAPGDFRCLTTLAAASVVDAAERLLAMRTGETAR